MNGDSGRQTMSDAPATSAKGRRRFQRGISLLLVTVITVLGVFLLMVAVERIQESADRTH
jgi:hypothetical protein